MASTSSTLLTVAQVVERLQISRPKLYEYLHDGSIRSLKIGACRRIPESEVEAFVAERLKRAGAA